MLRDSACGSTAVQAQVYERLRSLAQHAEFNNYLAYILARGPADARAAGAAAAASAPTSASTEPRDAEAVGVRQAAGLLLKNNLKRLYNSLQPPVQAYINGELLSAIGDDSKLIRSAVAVCITAIVSEAGLRGVFSFASAVPAAFLSCLCFFFLLGLPGRTVFFVFFLHRRLTLSRPIVLSFFLLHVCVLSSPLRAIFSLARAPTVAHALLGLVGNVPGRRAACALHHLRAVSITAWGGPVPAAGRYRPQAPLLPPTPGALCAPRGCAHTFRISSTAPRGAHAAPAGLSGRAPQLGG